MTMTDPGAAGMNPPPGPGFGDAPPPPPPPPPAGGWDRSGGGYQPPPRAWRPLRRSRQDRMLSGVAGGLGEYFGVDAVIFRVLFAVLTFFGGIGLIMYLLAWLLIPEPDVHASALDRGIEGLRARRVPPWLVIVGATLLLWLGWFSWWAPGPTFPALVLLAVLALVLVRRIGSAPPPPPPVPLWETTAGAPPTGPERPVDPETGAPTYPPADTAMLPVAPGWGPPTAPLIPPLSDTRRSMQAWFSEAGEAHRRRLRRRRPIKIAAGLGLVLGWAVVALLDGFRRVPFPAYLWVGLSILTAALLVSLVTRRMVLSLLIPIAVLGMVAIGLGGTRASLRDGSGQIGWMPTSADRLSDQRQFAGQSTLDLTRITSVPAARTITITQAAGEVVLRLPAALNATVVSDVHMGDVQNGSSREVGQYVSGLNVHLESPPATGVTGPALTVRVILTLGHVQIDRG